jgi:hypothetical protein
MFAEQLDDHLEEMAHHYSRSDNVAKAVKQGKRFCSAVDDANCFRRGEPPTDEAYEFVNSRALLTTKWNAIRGSDIYDARFHWFQ